MILGTLFQIDLILIRVNHLTKDPNPVRESDKLTNKPVSLQPQPADLWPQTLTIRQT